MARTITLPTVCFSSEGEEEVVEEEEEGLYLPSETRASQLVLCVCV